jgi:non-ribosomal peptide synthetase component F
MIFATALGLILHLESRQRHILIGTTPSQRDRRDIEGLIGYFVNMLPLPLAFDARDTLATTLARTRARTLDAFAHQSVPLERIQQALRPAGGRRTPGVQVVLTLQNSPMRLPPIVEDYRTIDNGTAKFDLVLNLVEHPDAFRGWWEYATDLFQPETIERLSDRLQCVLRLATVEPDLTIDALRARLADAQPPVLQAEHFQFPASSSAHPVDHERSGA